MKMFGLWNVECVVLGMSGGEVGWRAFCDLFVSLEGQQPGG